MAAKAAGNTTHFADKDLAVAAITRSAGMTGAGQFTDTIFAVPLSNTEATFAKGYLSFDSASQSMTCNN